MEVYGDCSLADWESRLIALIPLAALTVTLCRAVTRLNTGPCDLPGRGHGFFPPAAEELFSLLVEYHPPRNSLPISMPTNIRSTATPLVSTVPCAPPTLAGITLLSDCSLIPD